MREFSFDMLIYEIVLSENSFYFKNVRNLILDRSYNHTRIIKIRSYSAVT